MRNELTDRVNALDSLNEANTVDQELVENKWAATRATIVRQTGLVAQLYSEVKDFKNKLAQVSIFNFKLIVLIGHFSLL